MLPIAAAIIAAGPLPPPGASSCTGCHVAGGGVGVLQGKPAPDIVRQMEAYRADQGAPTLMNRIVKGFTPDEVVAMAIWFQGH